jgi:hypothetical protein
MALTGDRVPNGSQRSASFRLRNALSITYRGEPDSLALVQIHVYGVLDTAVIPVEMEELIPNLVEPFHVEWHVFSLGRHALFVAVNHCTQSNSPCLISSKLLIVRDRRLCGLHDWLSTPFSTRLDLSTCQRRILQWNRPESSEATVIEPVPPHSSWSMLGAHPDLSFMALP